MAKLFMTSIEATGWVEKLSTSPPPNDSIPISTSDYSLAALLELIDYLSLAVIKYAIHKQKIKILTDLNIQIYNQLKRKKTDMVFKSNKSQSLINEINAFNFYHPKNYTN